jgi:hypothetical protein
MVDIFKGYLNFFITFPILLMSFELKDFLDNCNTDVFFIDSQLDISKLKILYDNCLQYKENNLDSNEVVIVHPDIWFVDYFDLLSNFRAITKQPRFSLLRYEFGKFYSKIYDLLIKEFSSDNEFREFLTDLLKYRSIAVYLIAKKVDLKNLKVSWIIRYIDITGEMEIRNKKIDEIINSRN